MRVSEPAFAKLGINDSILLPIATTAVSAPMALAFDKSSAVLPFKTPCLMSAITSTFAIILFSLYEFG